jgi:hypothetical protein
LLEPRSDIGSWKKLSRLLAHPKSDILISVLDRRIRRPGMILAFRFLMVGKAERISISDGWNSLKECPKQTTPIRSMAQDIRLSGFSRILKPVKTLEIKVGVFVYVPIVVNTEKKTQSCLSSSLASLAIS